MEKPKSVTFPQLRHCSMTGRSVLLAPDRALRPNNILEPVSPRLTKRSVRDAINCPFCPGREYLTTLEVFAMRSPDSRPNQPGWELRIIPNMYPAVRDPATIADSIQDWQLSTAHGLHDIIIESAEHVVDPTDLDVIHWRRVLLAYQHRLREYQQDTRWQSAIVFKNVGVNAGASLEHLHSQMLALPNIYPDLQTELQLVHSGESECQYCQEVTVASHRIVAQTECFIILCTYAPRFAYEVWIVPRLHQSHFGQLDHEIQDDLALVLHRLCATYAQLLGVVDWNYYVHTAPLQDRSEVYHWHIEMFPRTSRPAGFEWGTGCYINAVPPETAAAALSTAWQSLESNFNRGMQDG